MEQRLTVGEFKKFLIDYVESRGFKNFEVYLDTTTIMIEIKLSSSEIKMIFLINYLKNEISFLVDFNEVIKRAIPQEQLIAFKDVYFKDTDGILGYGKGENFTYGKGLDYENNLTDLTEKLDLLLQDGTKLINLMADRLETINQGKFSSQGQTVKREKPKTATKTTKQGHTKNKKKKPNDFATEGLIFSFLFPPLGLLLSVIGLARVRKCQSGRKRSAVGMAISIVACVFLVFYIQHKL